MYVIAQVIKVVCSVHGTAFEGTHVIVNLQILFGVGRSTSKGSTKILSVRPANLANLVLSTNPIGGS